MQKEPNVSVERVMFKQVTKTKMLNKVSINDKKFVLGQYFTREEAADKFIRTLLNYKKFGKNIKILEPSSGTGNFVKRLKKRGFTNIQECEIDEDLVDKPYDFFLFDLDKKFNLIIGNPPFTKYNVKDSYFYIKDYSHKKIKPSQYLTGKTLNKKKLLIENAFILKSIKHLKDKSSVIGFVLPISFFIARKNKEIKEELMKRFNTIIIYQNDKNVVDAPIPCCFAIFTNLEENDNKNKIILIHEDKKEVKEVLDNKDLAEEESIPKTFIYKKNNNREGASLSKFLSKKIIKYRRDYKRNNVSGANILDYQRIPKGKDVKDYFLAVTRVGNSSIGKTGLINLKGDVLNEMFFVFQFREDFNSNKELKELICKLINKSQGHFKNISNRVGSKSMKKSDVFDFKIQEP